MTLPTEKPPNQSNTTGNESVAIARFSVAKRTIDRATVAKKRRSVAKLVDPLQILALVVAGPRGNGKFVCPLCTSTFGRRCEMKRHVAEVHTINGARRFQCNHPSCEKSFTRKDALAKHQVVKHQGKRRFVCPTCSEKFTSRYDLSRHNIRVHSNVKKRFSCEFCKAGFSQKSQLTMHKGRVHSSNKNQGDDMVRCSPMDSLAAAAVAIAKEEEKAASLKRPSTHKETRHTGGSPTQQREAADVEASVAKRTMWMEEAAAGTLAADTLLEAASVLQPVTCPSSVTTTTTMTGMSDASIVGDGEADWEGVSDSQSEYGDKKAHCMNSGKYVEEDSN